MFTKWKIKGFYNYAFGEDKKLYRMPYFKNGKYYDLREVKKQKGNRYYLYIEKEWLSEKSIIKRELLYLDPNPTLLKDEIKQAPF